MELLEFFGAIEGTRTPTPLPVHGPEPCASANSATMASGLHCSGGPEAAASARLRFYSTGAISPVKLYSSFAVIVIFALSTFDTGHPFSAASAYF
jgi:hypothetical protein